MSSLLGIKNTVATERQIYCQIFTTNYCLYFSCETEGDLDIATSYSICHFIWSNATYRSKMLPLMYLLWFEFILDINFIFPCFGPWECTYVNDFETKKNKNINQG